MVKVVTDTFERAWWRTYAATLADRFGQESIHLRRSGARISKVVRQVFGVSGLRPGQRAVIDALLAKRHPLTIVPTGAGKSLWYQVPGGLAVRSEAVAAGAA